MAHTEHHRSTRRAHVARLAAGALAAAALAGATLLAGVAVAATPTTASEISTSQDSSHGTFLVADHAVYTGSKACTGKCLKMWHPVLLPSGVMTATAGTGVDATKLGTAAASGGDLQVTYGGDRLYWYTKDKTASDVKGATSHKFGTWALVVTKAASGSGSGGSKSNTGTGGTAF